MRHRLASGNLPACGSSGDSRQEMVDGDDWQVHGGLRLVSYYCNNHYGVKRIVHDCRITSNIENESPHPQDERRIRVLVNETCANQFFGKVDHGRGRGRASRTEIDHSQSLRGFLAFKVVVCRVIQREFVLKSGTSATFDGQRAGPCPAKDGQFREPVSKARGSRSGAKRVSNVDLSVFSGFHFKL